MRKYLYSVLIILTTIIILIPESKEAEDTVITPIIIDSNIYAVAYVSPVEIKQFDFDRENYTLNEVHVSLDSVVNKNQRLMTVLCKQDLNDVNNLYEHQLFDSVTKKKEVNFNIDYHTKELIRLEKKIESLNMNYASDKIKKDDLLKNKYKLLSDLSKLELKVVELDMYTKQLSYKFEEAKKKCGVTGVYSDIPGIVIEVDEKSVTIATEKKQLVIEIGEEVNSRIKKHQEVELILENGVSSGLIYRSYIDRISPFPELVEGQNIFKVFIPVPASFPYGYRVKVILNEQNDIRRISSESNNDYDGK